MDDLDDNPIQYGVRKLAGYQAIGLDEAYQVLLRGEGDFDLAPAHVRRALGTILASFGYRERWVIPVDGDEGRLMWTRGPWPIDHGALRNRPVESFRAF